jgi:hypothetical protein
LAPSSGSLLDLALPSPSLSLYPERLSVFVLIEALQGISSSVKT